MTFKELGQVAYSRWHSVHGGAKNGEAKSGGTRHAVECALRRGKPVHVVGPTGLTEPVEFVTKKAF